MITFEEKLHPRKGLRLKFTYKYRAFQYLDFFQIITLTPPHKFIPLDLTFPDSAELSRFLNNRGILYDEVEIEYTGTRVKNEAIIVDTKRIYEVEESILKYLLGYKYYSINEVAEMLSFSRPTVYKLVNEDTLKAIRIYGQLRINHLDLMEFINQENRK